MKQRKIPPRHRNLLLGALGIAVCIMIIYVLSLHGLGIPCLFLKLTGFSCPGCGNTRAALMLLRLDVLGALKYNPLFPIEFFYLAWVIFHCCKSYLKGGRFSYQPVWVLLDAGILALVLLWWPLRNILGI